MRRAAVLLALFLLCGLAFGQTGWTVLTWGDADCPTIGATCEAGPVLFCIPSSRIMYCGDSDADGTPDQVAQLTFLAGNDKVSLRPDEDADGTGTIEVYGPFTNKATASTEFQFDANGDDLWDVELSDDGTNSGLILRNGLPFIQFGVGAKLKIKLCGGSLDAGFFYDEDDDGTYDAADDFCWGLGGYDYDCNCVADSGGSSPGGFALNGTSNWYTFNADEDGTSDVALFDPRLVDSNGDGTLDLDITAGGLGGLHGDATYAQRFAIFPGGYSSDPFDYTTGFVAQNDSASGLGAFYPVISDPNYATLGSGARADLGTSTYKWKDAYFSGTLNIATTQLGANSLAGAPAADGEFQIRGTGKIGLMADSDNDATGTRQVVLNAKGGTSPTNPQFTLDGSANTLTVDTDSDGTPDIRFDGDEPAHGEILTWDGTAGAARWAAGGASTQVDIDGDGTREISLSGGYVHIDPDEDGTTSYKIGSTNIYLDTNEDGTYNGELNENGGYSAGNYSFISNGIVGFTADNNEDGTGSILLNVEGKNRLIWDGLLVDCDGDGSALGYDVTTGTLVCGDDDTGGGGANIWTTIDASSGTDPTPDSTADTLTLTAGTGISITGDSSTDTITIASTVTGDVTDVFNCASGDCQSITVADGDKLDFSAVNNSATTEGLILPQESSVLTGTATGQVGYDTNGNALYAGGAFNGLQIAVPVTVQGPEYVQLFGDMLGLTVASALVPFSMSEGTAVVVASTDANPQTSSSSIGLVRVPTGTTAGNEASMGIAYSANTSSQSFEPRKMRLFGVRGYSDTQAVQATRKLAVGGVRTSSDGNPATKTDGIYFFCDPAADLDNDGTVGDIDTDGTGTTAPDGDCEDAGEDADDCKWYAVTMNNATDNAKISTATNTTATKTTTNCSNVTTFQTLEIAYDGSTANFYIDGASAASISTNIPADGRRLWNWGVYVDQNIAAAKSWVVDWMRYYGIR